jgi:hypothetical protein
MGARSWLAGTSARWCPCETTVSARCGRETADMCTVRRADFTIVYAAELPLECRAHDHSP